jgi:FixJ family two-component response regulator
MLPGTKGFIAVVDDESAVLDSLQDLLESRGYSVRSFLSAEEFLESDAIEVIGCLISDIQLPGMDGWSLDTLVMNHRPLLPVIFITAHGDIDQLQGVKRSHEISRDIFKKPFDGTRLLAVIDAVFLEPDGAR